MCVLTATIAAECKNGKSGIEAIWAVEKNSADVITENSGEITTLTLDSARVFFRWNFAKDSAKYDMDIVPSIENGTETYNHKINLKFYKYETTKRNEMKLIAQAPLLIIAKDFNGNYFLLGKDRGMDMQQSTVTSGAKIGDFNGFELNFMSEEPEPITALNSATVTSLSLP